MAARVDPIDALRGANRSTDKDATLAQKMLVITQAAVSVVLLCAAGLLLLSDEALRGAGLSRPKVAHARSLAAAYAEGRLTTAGLAASAAPAGGLSSGTAADPSRITVTTPARPRLNFIPPLPVTALGAVNLMHTLSRRSRAERSRRTDAGQTTGAWRP